ncbi:MAG: RNA polymerase factor sigma-54 [Verrucomicrobiota bacterium]
MLGSVVAGPELSQYQGVELQQRLSPQMQQSLQILQAPTMELRQLIQQELEANPVLEDETEEISADAEFEEEFAELSQLDEEWRDYYQQMSPPRPSKDEDEKRQFLFETLVRPTTLQEHLLEQLAMSDAPRLILERGSFLIGNIDDSGFLQTSIEDLALTQAIPYPELEQARELLIAMEPPGVGAIDLRECLLIQLERMNLGESLEYKVVDKHLEDLSKKRYPQIARALNVTTERINRAAEIIAGLDPRPGQQFSSRTSTVVVPDVHVVKDSDSFVVQMDDTYVPRLRISNLYKDLMTNSGAKNDVRSYIRDKVRNGKFLIRSIYQRQDTIRKIAEEIVERQQDYFRLGKSHLRPMTMSQVADAVGVHETTVSRAIAGKYMTTPRGVVEIKSFFTPGYKTDTGENISNSTVKTSIQKLIRDEDAHKPISDQKIVELLKSEGIDIARRTVAKYRDALGILPSSMRKTF